MAELAALIKDVKGILACYSRPQVDCARLDTKALSRGRRFDLFLLGYSLNKRGSYVSGISEDDWLDVTNRLRDRIDSTLGECDMLVEAWSATSRFQARFETYVMYSEMRGT